MPRVKGSKNKPKDQKVVDTDQISEDKNLVKDPIKEPIQVFDSISSSPLTPVIRAAIEIAKKNETKDKVLLGYHPITGAEVWH
jgi:hypothetical protein